MFNVWNVAICQTFEITFLFERTTAFGAPSEPEVNKMTALSSGVAL